MELYISDVDGTLIDGDKQMPLFSRAMLTGLLNEGCPFTIASARSIVTLKEILGDLPIRLPVIESNGAFLTDWQNGRHVAVQAMDAHTAVEVWRILRATGCTPIIVTFNGREDCVYCPPACNPGMAQYYEERRAQGDRRQRPLQRVEDHLAEAVVMLVAIEQRPVLEEAAAELKSHLGQTIEMHLMENLYQRQWFWLTVHDPQATKGHAAKRLKAEFVEPKCRMIVFGDHDNDVSLFDAADHRVAVANATDTLKRLADEVIGSNAEGAVARYVDFRWRKLLSRKES